GPPPFDALGKEKVTPTATMMHIFKRSCPKSDNHSQGMSSASPVARNDGEGRMDVANGSTAPPSTFDGSPTSKKTIASPSPMDVCADKLPSAPTRTSDDQIEDSNKSRPPGPPPSGLEWQKAQQQEQPSLKPMQMKVRLSFRTDIGGMGENQDSCFIWRHEGSGTVVIGVFDVSKTEKKKKETKRLLQVLQRCRAVETGLAE
ncbi:unnamed protein product, partial [Choristocarpus tenellus]